MLSLQDEEILAKEGDVNYLNRNLPMKFFMLFSSAKKILHPKWKF